MGEIIPCLCANQVTGREGETEDAEGRKNCWAMSMSGPKGMDIREEHGQLIHRNRRKGNSMGTVDGRRGRSFNSPFEKILSPLCN